MSYLFLFLFSCYALLIIFLSIGFIKIKIFESKSTIAETGFSIIIPFRNEEEKLPGLLSSIAALDYPDELVEFIFINDASNDTSVAIIRQNFETHTRKNKNTNFYIADNIRSSNSPKKDAISTAISSAKNEWIVTTDADCILPDKWLLTLDAFIQQKRPEMIVAPVNYIVKDNFLEQFQLLDFLSLQGTTQGAFGINLPFLCNGANLSYKKETFLQLNGFVGNDNIASGDDIFLFEKFISKNKESVQFLKSKDAIVATFPVKTWFDLLQQRMRWASKTSNLKSKTAKLIGLLVFLTNVSIILSLFLDRSMFLTIILLTTKITIDMLLFLPTIKFFNHRKSFLNWYLISSILYPFFSLSVILKSIFAEYYWKGRSFKK
jgi:cellulose synthase/poly-beta-1,6-N-acetylglucosamine synthase-like glycosyltransferase